MNQKNRIIMFLGEVLSFMMCGYFWKQRLLISFVFFVTGLFIADKLAAIIKEDAMKEVKND
jgi:hypothetical protein